MKRIRNNRGAALLIVLLTITLIGIFAPIILSIVLSESLQTDRTEENMQTRHIAEMGVEHFRQQTREEMGTIIEEYVTENEDVTKQEIVQYVCGMKDNTGGPQLSDFDLFPPPISYYGKEFIYSVQTTGDMLDQDGNSIGNCNEYDSLALQFTYRSTAEMEEDGELKAETTIMGPVFIDLSSTSPGNGEDGDNGNGDSGDGDNGSGDSEPPDDRVFHDEEEFDNITDDSHYPEIPDDIDYTETTEEEIGNVTNPHLTEDNVEFPKETTIVEGSLLIDNDSEIDTQGRLEIGGHATFNGFTTLNNQAGLEIGGNASFTGADFHNHADMTVKGDATFGGHVEFNQHTTSTIDGNSVFHEGFTMLNHSFVDIGGNLYAADAPTIHNTNAILNIGGSAMFENGLDNQGDITIEGNAFFREGELINTGTICVYGRIEGVNPQRIQEVHSCGEGAGIYMLNQEVSSPYEDTENVEDGSWDIDFGENDY